jgi:EAL and modified HD-GYP domain-containing signal transduction protein
MAGLDVVVGRQPIFDAELVVTGYELLVRALGPDGDGGHRVDASDFLTADAVFASDDAGLARLAGKKRAFCHATDGVLAGAVPITLAPERTVIEIPRAARVDDDVSAACRRLHGLGYTLALDDVTFFDASEGLLELASIVKLDLAGADADQLPGLHEQCRESGVSIVAKNVDNPDDLHRGTDLGFDLFQGYLLAHPRPAPGRPLEAGRLAQLRMSSQLLDQEFSLPDIEAIIRTDPAMTHQLLQLAGIGAAGGMRREVSTLREALVLVGWRRLQSWVALLMLTDKGAASEEAIATTLARARMAELVGGGVDPGISGPAFMAGLLSCLDVLLGAPIEEIMQSLPVTDELRDAVVGHEGPLGAVVADVTDYQLGRPASATRAGVGDVALMHASFAALTWAVEMTGALERVELD